MGWHERRVEEEKAQFILDWTSGRWTRTELCARYGVSREAGYELVRRYAVCGMSCVLKRSRARHTQERATADEVVAALVEERQKHPSWGPKKLVARLAEQHPEVGWPAASTAGDILHRMGLVRSRRRRGTPLEPQKPFAWATKPNALWCVDFKGWFQTRDKTRCDPLTVTDAVSRYLIECRIVPPTHDGVWPEMDRLFREHGLPELIRSDNGPPFGSRSAGGLTRLSAHWLKLGIGLERIEPGHPEQNGRHERMHGTLKAETLKPPAATPAEQQQLLRRVPPGLQRGTAARGIGPDAAGSALGTLDASLSEPYRGSGLRRRPHRPASPLERRDPLECRPALPQRGTRRRGGWHRRDRDRRAHRPLRRP